MRSIGLAFSIAALLGLTATPRARAQTLPPEEDEMPWADTAFVILRSTVSYRAAAEAARTAAHDLGVKLDLRGLVPHRTLGLTMSREVCQEGGDFPCYWPRGTGDDGLYISVEHTSAYEDIEGDLYFVVLASGPRDSDAIKQALRKARGRYPDVYVKNSRMYLGCGH